MRYGVVIDSRKCIGCHSCTVACKTENRVPLGVNRTWVKYVEKGKFPHARRIFQVTRCNHCEKPPCVEICPVSAMYQRKDGIVDFNSARCIGCKACMQACPYDAIYVDPYRNTAAKCHFCAHRVEVGLEPACAAVCPEHALVAGDLDDPESEVAQLLARETVRVRKPEQGTRPKVFYIDGDESTMAPTAARHESFYMWAERNQQVHGGGAAYLLTSPFLQKNTLAAYDVAHDRLFLDEVHRFGTARSPCHRHGAGTPFRGSSAGHCAGYTGARFHRLNRGDAGLRSEPQATILERPAVSSAQVLADERSLSPGSL
jgi:Fe-S-cluster-containing dehydrogenase component